MSVDYLLLKADAFSDRVSELTPRCQCLCQTRAARDLRRGRGCEIWGVLTREFRISTKLFTADIRSDEDPASGGVFSLCCRVEVAGLGSRNVRRRG